jgi:hypothetical protein
MRLEQRVSIVPRPGVQDRGEHLLGSLGTVPSMWTSRRAVSLHVALIVFVPGCVALTWWQLARALGGNTLSWVYTFEWPFFGVYAVFMWWKLVHDEPVTWAGRRKGEEALSDTPDSSPGGAPPAAVAGAGVVVGADEVHGEEDAEPSEEDDELAAYNRYLSDLNASGRQKRW